MYSLLDLIWDFFRKPNISDIQIVNKTIIEGSDVKNILSSFTNNIWISDEKFFLIDILNIKEFLLKNVVSERKYFTEGHDCDDFSFELMGEVRTLYSNKEHNGSFGIVWGFNTEGSPHAWNFFINENKKVMFVEPQNDIVFEPTTEKVWIMIL